MHNDTRNGQPYGDLGKRNGALVESHASRNHFLRFFNLFCHQKRSVSYV